MLKKVLAAVLVLCMMLAALTACGITGTGNGTGGDASGTGENTGEAGPNAADPASIKVTVDLPDGWEEKAGNFANYQAVKGTSMFTVTSSKKPSDDDDIAEYVNKNIDIMKQAFGDAVYSATEKTDIDGTEGVRFHMDIETSGIKQRQIYCYYFKHGLVIMVQGAYLLDEDDAEATDAEIEKLFSSVKTEIQ
ncbi:MAG TPA: hypothetical protein PK127_02555 [Clostridiales bacterium]|nr:hypothetical protein [Clostridiales bacterium]HPV01348.1 hypothetical protein [Clostridiales bacterium]